MGNVLFVMGCCLDSDESALKVFALVNSIGEHQRMEWFEEKAYNRSNLLLLILLSITL